MSERPEAVDRLLTGVTRDGRALPGSWTRPPQVLSDYIAQLEDEVEALDELLATLADARRRYRAGDARAIESNALAATETAARRLRSARDG